MKVSEMSPADNALHKYFADAAAAFQEAEPWVPLLNVQVRFDVLSWGPPGQAGQPQGEEEQAEFTHVQLTKSKLQLFREYGDVMQAERTRDIQSYAAPEGHVEVEIRPERVEGEAEKVRLPRANVYVPNMIPKGFEETYTKRAPHDRELYMLAVCTRASLELQRLAAEKLVRKPPAKLPDHVDQRLKEYEQDPVYEPFEVEVAVPSMAGSDGGEGEVRLRVTNTCFLPRTAKKCAHCSRWREAMDRCAGCRIVHYCTREHQKLDWKNGHKHQCAVQAKLLEEFTRDFTDDAAMLPLMEPPADADAAAPCCMPRGALEEHSAINEVVVSAEDMLRRGACSRIEGGVEAVAQAVAQVAMPPCPGDLGSWKAVYELFGWDAANPAFGAALTNVMTVYQAIVNMSSDVRRVFEEKDTFTIHIADASFEVHAFLFSCFVFVCVSVLNSPHNACNTQPTELDAFKLLLCLLPSFSNAEGKKKSLRIVFIGRRLSHDLHYRVFTYSEAAQESYEEAAPTGVLGDYWRGSSDAPLALRFYCDDYSTFMKKSEGVLVCGRGCTCPHAHAHAQPHRESATFACC